MVRHAAVADGVADELFSDVKLDRIHDPMSDPIAQVVTEAAVETGDGVRFQGDKTHAYKHNKRSTPALPLNKKPCPET